MKNDIATADMFGAPNRDNIAKMIETVAKDLNTAAEDIRNLKGTNDKWVERYFDFYFNEDMKTIRSEIFKLRNGGVKEAA